MNLDYNKNNVKGVSLDIWGTLLTNNQKTKPTMFAEYQKILGLNDVPFAVFDSAYRSADKFADGINLTTNEDFGLRQRLTIAFRLMNFSIYDVNENLIDKHFQELYDAQMRIAQEIPPKLVSDSIPAQLGELKKNNVKVAIASNTGSYPEELMMLILDELGIGENVDFFGFSDTIGHVKPFGGFFDVIKEGLNLPAESIVHIGDNKIADIQGAKDAGMQALYVEKHGHGNESIANVLKDLVKNTKRK